MAHTPRLEDADREDQNPTPEAGHRRAAPTDPDPDTDDRDDQDVDVDDPDTDVDEEDEQHLQVAPHVLESEEARAAAYDGLNAQEREKLDDLAEQIARREADKELIDELARSYFTGPGYDAFADDLARYALSVLGGWLRTGHVWGLTRALSPSENERLEFSDNEDSRLELAAMTIAVALPKFREKALLDRGWDHEKGASIATYFMRACVFALPNQLRAHRRQRKRWQHQDDSARGELVDLDRGAVTDTADIAVGNQQVMDHLRGLDEREQRIVAATLDGYSQNEMLEMFPETSVRAIEGVMYRWRTRGQKTLTQQAADQATDSRRSDHA